MPLYEFVCPVHGKFESYVALIGAQAAACPTCEAKSDAVEFSVPAKRNPEYGIQK